MLHCDRETCKLKYYRRCLHLSSGPFYKFMFVREPMDRLASLYYDKFVLNPDELLVQIRKDVKELALEFNHVVGGNSSELLTFQEFLQIVVLKQNGESKWMKSAGWPHWAPYYSFCSVCSIKYDFIGKLDSESDDIKVMDHT